MTDRDTAASTPDPDDVPREPSKQELDAGRASGVESPLDPVGAPEARHDDLAWPAGADDAPVAASATKYPPSRPAVIAGAILAAVLLALAILAAFQDPKSYMSEINKQQIAGVAQVLKDEKVADYTSAEIKTAQQSFADEGATRDMTNESAAAALNAGKPDSVTAGQIKDVLAEKKAQFQTVEALQSGLRSQIILFTLTGLLMAAGTLFYQRGKAWARYIGMFVSGFIAVMYVMQVVQGALNIPGIVITLAAIAAFYFFMKGRLEDPPAPRPGGGGFGGFGSLFAPRGPRNRPAE
ncbi:hypothetical protein [Cumulibacter manganitolerans]|uniref:hypothetical protein n=1 Tax=Cumulibacter manganitolerans TaxID=1884992 RepID=UPI0012980CAC|nr:hypothetical protein [Cumulibacter manganitolerans]